jgi:putative nucleotidyltransferase with HDIG domain
MLRRDGTSFVAEVGLSALTDLAGGRTAFVCAVRDITERRRSREELVRSAQTLRRTMEGVIDAMSSAVERRDPYTAGHQRRVARLAVAIAAEMGLDEHTIDGIRLAAGVHDVGKISVPAEILSKPGRLLEGEFSLIKAHPEVGAEILRSIEFSWPIADIVIEHHERLDGTGYPHGLRGSEVRLEPRIIAVADVVEAMASHRPYRPSLGIEAALKEIETYAGLLYDSKVAHVCLRLFRERGFDLDGK